MKQGLGSKIITFSYIIVGLFQLVIAMKNKKNYISIAIALNNANDNRNTYHVYT